MLSCCAKFEDPELLGGEGWSLKLKEAIKVAPSFGIACRVDYLGASTIRVGLGGFSLHGK